MEYMNEFIDLNTLQQLIREKRRLIRLTYDELANKTGLSKSTLQRYEKRDIKGIPFESVIKIAAGLGINPVELFVVNSDAIIAELLNTSYLRTQISALNDFIVYEKKVHTLLLPSLISEGFSVELLGDKNLGDILAKKGSERWYIDYHYERDNQLLPVSTGQSLTQLQVRYGKVAMSEMQITKYSLVESQRLLAEQLIYQKPKHLALDFSVLLMGDDIFEELYN